MSPERELQEYLIAAGTACASRWYARRAPERPPGDPYGVIWEFASDQANVHGGVPGIKQRSIRVYVFSTKQDQSIAVADAVRVLLDGFKGTMGAIVVKAIFYRDQEYNFAEVAKLHESCVQYDLLFA
jgi:hypothetical protein